MNPLEETFTTLSHVLTPAEQCAYSWLIRYRNDNTRRGYERNIFEWLNWCRDREIEPLAATRVHIEAYTRWLELKGLQQSTIAGKQNALAGFYRFAIIDEYIVKNPMVHVARITVPRESTTNGLRRGELHDVLRAAEEHSPRLAALRVRHEGGRRRERERLVAGQPVAGPGTCRPCGGRRDLGITKRISPHSFRHAFVTLSLDAGAAIRDVQNATGHADSRMVSYYDRNRESLDRNPTHGLSAFIDGMA